MSAQVKLSNKCFENWAAAKKEAQCRIDTAKEDSVWSSLEIVDEEALVAAGEVAAFRLRCIHCYQSCQLGNPHRWCQDHKRSEKCSKKRSLKCATTSHSNSKRNPDGAVQTRF
jgi:hypothetical protein